MPNMFFPDKGRITQTGQNSYTAASPIISNVSAARAVYEKLRLNHLKRINLYKEIEGLIQGNPPYDPNELRSANLQHIANFNDMSARATIERACKAYWNLLYSAQYLTRFVLRSPDPEAPNFAAIMSEHWDYAVKKHWPSFLINVAALQRQLVTFGIAPLLFPDERSPKWRVVELHRFFIPDQAQADLDLLTTVAVETEFSIQYLWQVYQEFKDRDADASPWNVKQLGMLLASLGNTPTKEPIEWFELERRLLSGDISFDRMFNDTIRIVSLFQKEFEGKISHYMFHRLQAGVPVTGTTEDFIFYQKDQFQNIGEGMIIFTMDPGEYTIHSNRGLGHKIFSLAQAKLMLDCSVVDGAKWASTPIIKSSSFNTTDVDQIRFYPGAVTNIRNYDLQQNNLGSNLQNVIGAAQYLSSLMQFNITYSGSDPAAPDPDKGSLSPIQTKLMAFREFGILKNSIAHFYNTFDKLIQNMTMKMLRSKASYPEYEMAEEWKDRCIEDGVPEEIFDIKDTKSDKYGMPKHIDVYAARACAAGSQTAQLLALNELKEIAGGFGPREEKFFKKQFIMATVGPEYIESYLQEGDDVDESSGGASLAGVENAIIQAGKSPVFSPDNEHRAHFAVHSALAVQTIQNIQQQKMDVIEADSIFSVLVPHMSEHLQQLEQNPFANAFVTKVKSSFEQIVKYSTLNKANAAKSVQAKIEKQQQAQEQQQQIMNDEQLKNLTTMNDEKRKDLKLSAQAQRQERAGAAKEAALEKKTEGELDIKRRQAEGETQIKTQKAQHEIMQNNAVAQAETNPSGYLEQMNGETPAPYDIEGIEKT